MKKYQNRSEPSSKRNQFDVIILGSGIVEASLAALLAVCQGKKVLIIDRNNYLGDQFVTLPIHKYVNFKPNLNERQKEKLTKICDEDKKSSWKWRLTMCNKIFFTESRLCKLLLKTNSHHFVNWNRIDSSFCFKHQKQGIFEEGVSMFQVPVKKDEGMFSNLGNIFENRKISIFFEDVIKKGLKNEKFKQESVKDYMKEKNISYDFHQFISHSMAFMPDEKADFYPIQKLADKLFFYRKCMMTKFGNSPFIYPEYGISEICSLLCHKAATTTNSIFLSGTNVQQFIVQEQKICGVRTNKNQTYYSPIVISSPSYAKQGGLKQNLVQKYKVIRCMCIVNHKFIPDRLEQFLEDEVKGFESGVIILPYDSFNRQTDIYMTFLSSQQKMSPSERIEKQIKQFHFVVIISAVRQKSDISAQQQLQCALKLLQPYDFCDIEICEHYRARNQNGKTPHDDQFIYLDPFSQNRQVLQKSNYESFKTRYDEIERRKLQIELYSHKFKYKPAEQEERRELERNKKNLINSFNQNYHKYIPQEREELIRSIEEQLEENDLYDGDEQVDFQNLFEEEFQKLIKMEMDREIENTVEKDGPIPVLHQWPIIHKLLMQEPQQLNPHCQTFKHPKGLFITDSSTFFPHFQKQVQNCLTIYQKITKKDIRSQLDSL